MAFKTVAPQPPMSKNRQNPPAQERAAQPERARNRAPGQWPVAARVIVSSLVIWHVSALFLAPLSIPPASPLVQNLAQYYMQPYLDALYINHGYHFFAPEPSNGHLIRYQLMDTGGRVIAEGEFPNRKDNWPRLLYHRYFMLADQCEVPAGSEAETTAWKRQYLNAYAQQLLREHAGAATARVQRITHFPLLMRDALAGKPLTYPETYRTDLEVVAQRQGDAMPAPNQSGAWNNNWRQDVASGWQGGFR